MEGLRVRIERDGDGYRVLTASPGAGGWWGVGVTFPMWVFAMNVASAIAAAFPGSEIIDETRDAMTVERMRELLRAGKKLMITVGTGPDDPTIVLSLVGGTVMCESVGGWSAGVVEPACALESDYLGTYLRHSIEVLGPNESGWAKMNARAAQALA